MAKQSGILPIEGTLGNITFFKSADGFMVRQKGGVSGSKIANDPNFQRTRENNAEFGRAGKAGRLLRIAFRTTIQQAKDRRMISRLTTAMLRVIQLDATNPRGQRNVIDGEAELLLGFDFNLNGKMSQTFFAPYTATIDRVTGAATVSIPSFVPANMMGSPTGSTHFKLHVAAAAMAFEQGSYTAGNDASGYLPIDSTATAAINLNVALPPASTHPLFLVLCVEFLQDVNGIKYPLKNGAFNACAIVSVDGGV
jgi:hypothetical protein